jgi:single-strand DNA-binding protein
MNKASLIVVGYLAKDPELRYTQSGDPVLSLTVPFTPRKMNRETNSWEDAGATLWVESSVWGAAAETLAPLLSKGTNVRLEGQPVMRAWESSGKSGVNLEIKFPDVSVIPSVPRAGQGAVSEEPWATSPPADGGAWDKSDETPF